MTPGGWSQRPEEASPKPGSAAASATDASRPSHSGSSRGDGYCPNLLLPPTAGRLPRNYRPSKHPGFSNRSTNSTPDC